LLLKHQMIEQKMTRVYVGRSLLLLLLCTLLGACSSAEANPNLSTRSPTIAKTNTVVNLSSKTSTLTRSSTPSLTVSPSASATISNEKIQATETEQAFAIYETKIAEFKVGCDGQSSISPKENWIAVSCRNNKHQALEISNKNGIHWSLNFKDYLSDAVLNPVHWTYDERYLYFDAYVNFEGGGTCFYGYGEQGLFRIDLINGKVSTVLPPTSWNGYLFAFSPTGRWLAYEGFGDPAILDLRTGEKIAIDKGRNAIGNFTWSPDGTELAYATCEMSPDFTVNKSAIEIFNTKSRSSRTIEELEKSFLTIEEWNDGNVIKIRSEDDRTGDSSYAYFDTLSSIFVTVTPAP
jgi:hypothetical protein